MINALWRGRVLLILLAGISLLATTGCYGLTDLQVSSILQSTITTGLATLVEVILAAAAGVPLQPVV